jgi:UDP-N-acetylmuramoylalanine--D-glutamate ligase
MFRNMSSEQVAFLNVDEPSVTEADIRAIPGDVSLRRFSPSGQGAADGHTRRIGDSLWLSGQEVALADLPWYGDHNLSNAMLAWELATSQVRADIGMFKGLMAFRNLGHRMELLGERHGVRVVNNSMCTNPMAVVASSRSVPGRQHLLMGGKTKNLDFAPVNAYLKENAHKVYLFGPEPHVLNNMIGGSWPQYETLEAAFAAATDAAQAGETILLAPGCASADPYVHFRERGEAFRAMAKEWLEQ